MTQATSPYAGLFSLGASLVQGWAARYGAKQEMRVNAAQFSANRRIAAANNALFNQQAEIENKMRAGQNRIIMAQARAEQQMRQISNKRILIRAEMMHEQATENFLRTQESMVQGGLEEQIKAAEQRGAFAASAALSGTQGTTIETMERSLELKQARADEYRVRQNNYATYDQLRQMAGIIPGAIGSLDTSQSVPMLDYGYSFSQAKSLGPEKLAQMPIMSNFFTDGLKWAMSNEDGFRQAADTVSSWFRPRGADVPMFNALP